MDTTTILHDEQISEYSASHNGGNLLVSQDVLVTDEDTLEADTYEGGAIYPYTMPEEVDIREDPHSVYEWVRKLDRGMLIIDPEFQRNLVWQPEQKSQFIESLLVNIPLPPLYVNQRSDGKYIVVDGLQRTTTLIDFVKDRFVLSDLKLLKNLNGHKFSTLQSQEQARIEDRKLLIYVIKPSVPLPMVYDIFHRINTGGTQLTRQEIRNCFYIGKATHLLKELSEKDYFRRAIDNGISPKRMKDREAILRYLAFKIQDYKVDYKNDMDAFLSEAMKKINQMNLEEIESLRIDFERVMKRTYEFFGKNNFRLPTSSGRGRINIALMEAVSYFFLKKSDQFLDKHEQIIKMNFQHLLENVEFTNTVRFATGDKRRVIERFELAQRILGDVKC
jgi:uncharacterized protein with ParB-like and HNH nuclease domain